MQVGILVFNSKKEIVLVNNPLSKILGYKKNELLNTNINHLLTNKTIISNYIKKPQLKKFKATIELTGVHKDGHEIFLEMSFGKMEYEGDIYFKAFVSDITLRKQKEAEISNLNVHLEEEVKHQNKELEKVIEQLKISLNKEKELNNLKTKFIALASHEFKTPLSAILSSTELMAKYADLENFEKQKEHLEKVKTSINHLNGMLDDLLTLENIENGEISSNFTHFNLSNLAQELLKNSKPLLKEHQQLVFENNCDETIYHDAKIISIILRNLLSNAIKYSAEDGIIQVIIKCKKTAIYFSVKDNGIGIPKNEQPLIFNRFFRAKNALCFPGTGIGLNIVKGYINRLNGTISFHSTAYKRTIFKVQLPKLTNHEKDSFIN